MGFANAGLLAGEGPVTLADLDLLRQAGLEAVKLRAIVNPASDLPIYRDAGIHTFLVQLLSSKPGQDPTSPQQFVDRFAPAAEAFVRDGVRDFEIHGEPNRADRGYGVSWQSGSQFGDWFSEVARLLKTAFGPQVRLGFPGLAPPPPRQVGVAPVVSQGAFLAECADAVRGADFVCCQVYWEGVEGLRAFDGGLAFVHQYLETFPSVPLIISEFANVNPSTSSAARGNQYAEFYLACAQYDACRYDWPWYQAFWPRVQAAYAFILRSPDPIYQPQVWMGADGEPLPVVARVAARSRMPDPARLRLTWPTEYRHYTQFYGENHRHYYDASTAHSLHGGHNGADLQVRYDDPAASPILSCLDGEVTDRQMIETGYGHHLTVRSQVAGVGEVTLLYGHMTDVTVRKGQRVRAGEPLGTAGSTGASTGPHLHLSFKIEGLRFPGNGDHLNPRPYLDPPSAERGQPRVGYHRTYVLLPPDADSVWAKAVVAGGWDRRRFTIGGSGDDAGIGDLDFRRVVAVNPDEWEDDLYTFFETHYPGVFYTRVRAETPEALREALASLPDAPGEPPDQPAPPRGKPRVGYARTYVLLPPDADSAWAEGVVDGAWDQHRFTIGGSGDDAGIGDLDYRRVIAINPDRWEDDLLAFFEIYYPGVLYVPVTAETPEELADLLAAF